MNKKVEQTLTKGQAVDQADAELFNENVKGVDLSGDIKRGSDKFKPKKETLDRQELSQTISVDTIYGGESSLYVDGDRFGDGVRVVGWAADERRGERNSHGFSIYFDTAEEIIDFAERCLDTLAIKEQKNYLFEQYEGNIPGITNHMPSLLQKTMCKTGRFYWDGEESVCKEITKDTPEEILDNHPSYSVDDDGNFDQDWWNRDAEELLKGLIKGRKANWQGDDYMGINLGELEPNGTYRNGIHARKVRSQEDKRRKVWVTTFFFKDGSQTNLDGRWDLLDNGTLRRETWLED